MNNLIVFDLDDTLFKEIDFLKSAYKEIAKYLDENYLSLSNKMINDYFTKVDVFKICEEIYKINKSELIKLYRNHLPDSLPSEINLNQFLIEFKKKGYIIGLITDGRSNTQRNKLKALNIENIFDLVVISEEIGTEKPNEKNFKLFDQFNCNQKYYIGDNTSKDFITPNQLGWTTICLLDNGENIHKQYFDLENKFLPKYKINSLNEIIKILI